MFHSRIATVPLLLLPGTLCDGREFAPVVDGLDRPVITVPLANARSIPEMAARILADTPERFALCGFSLGAGVALEIVAQAPDRVERLALIGGMAGQIPQEFAEQRRRSVWRAASEGFGPLIDDIWEETAPQWRRKDRAFRDEIVAMADATTIDSYSDQIEMQLNRRDHRGSLAAIEVPTLIVCGAEDGACPPALSREMAEKIPGARLVIVPDAGHFVTLDQPKVVAEELRRWLAAPPHHTHSPQGDPMADADPDAKSAHISRIDAPTENVLQVERRDYPELAPTNRPRSQSLEGFDDVYTDIVDYIVRCTHKIWDERDVGLIYTHYTHNCVVYGTTGTVYNREDMVRDTIQRLVSYPERRGMATQVIWNGNDKDGFYTSHLVTGSGRHTQFGHYGSPTGRPFVSRTIADCMVIRNKIYREWVVADNMAIVRQLGLDPHKLAMATAKSSFDRGLLSFDIGENRRLLGQNPPEWEADTSIANTELEADVLRWLHEIFNKRMFGKIKDVYAPTCQYHGPLMRELYGSAAVLHQHLALIGSIPDASYSAQHIASVESEEGGTKVAVRWVMEGHHLGYGLLEALGTPTGKRLQVMGITHYHIKDGKIVDEWNVYDELALLTQLKLAQLADGTTVLA